MVKKYNNFKTFVNYCYLEFSKGRINDVAKDSSILVIPLSRKGVRYTEMNV